MHQGIRHFFVAACAMAAAAVGSVTMTGPADAARSGESFIAGEQYRGGFPDPTVFVDQGRYYASSTTIANLNLPMMSSADAETWFPKPALADYQRYSSWRKYNEAMVTKPAWAAQRGTRERVPLISQWAPSLAKIGTRYLAAFSAAVRLEPRHSCISIASSDRVFGMYHDARSVPLVCQKRSPKGAIDPDFFVDDDGTPYLLWKFEGIPGEKPPRLMIRQLDATGLNFAPGSTPRRLVTRDQGWEGPVVENPSMVKYRGAYLLFYSGNQWATSRYATGYAVCSTPLGPCRKPTSTPVLSSDVVNEGPGGADAFLDVQGRLRLAYAAYRPGQAGASGAARYLHVATVDYADGLVSVLERSNTAG